MGKVLRRKKNRNTVIIPGQGDPCPRCHRPTQIREHIKITPKLLKQACFYSRWFCCINMKCPTKEIMPSRFAVWKDHPEKPPGLEPGQDVVMDVLAEKLPPDPGPWMSEEEHRRRVKSYLERGGRLPWQAAVGGSKQVGRERKHSQAV